MVNDWVDCPICGCDSMWKEIVNEEGDAIIHCTNHACASNGGSNAEKIQETVSPELAKQKAVIEAIAEILGSDKIVLQAYRKVNK